MIRTFLQSIHSVDTEILENYLAYWQPFHCPKKTIITFQGQRERYIYFVEEGIQKSYYLHQGKPHVIAFTYPPSFSGIPESFITQTPSHYFLESITDSTFLRISYEQHQQLMQQHRPIETLVRKATELVLVGLVQRQYELMALDIQSRFTAFVKRSPHLLNMVPHKDLASYLRIDPTNFSKLLSSVKI
ncbi:Crp/Fnr family transcriptional regulator [Tunicatimonas pelagia]|uniref:Crp/Fnr family transcriptional regulator n=1 Tax=Tunicatimonas pelagia TaxID=931531 RepID=UPI002665041C|nr:Crp/Fnr family transcriptional regulator [Tunicatimonas pelagia]WKN41555.1 Crp/Fnr family transcriptional regulator [Tunicatimonas pelagia]